MNKWKFYGIVANVLVSPQSLASSKYKWMNDTSTKLAALTKRYNALAGIFPMTLDFTILWKSPMFIPNLATLKASVDIDDISTIEYLIGVQNKPHAHLVESKRVSYRHHRKMPVWKTPEDASWAMYREMFGDFTTNSDIARQLTDKEEIVELGEFNVEVESGMPLDYDWRTMEQYQQYVYAANTGDNFDDAVRFTKWESLEKAVKEHGKSHLSPHLFSRKPFAARAVDF